MDDADGGAQRAEQREPAIEGETGAREDPEHAAFQVREHIPEHLPNMARKTSSLARWDATPVVVYRALIPSQQKEPVSLTHRCKLFLFFDSAALRVSVLN